MARNWLPAYIALGTVWGCSFLFIKMGLEFLTPFGVAFGRCALGAITLLIYSKIRGISFPRERHIWIKLWLLALIQNIIPGILFAFAEVRVTSVLAGIINATTPLVTLIAILIVFREEKPRGFQIIGLIIGSFGVLIVLGVWKGLGHNNLVGILALLAAVTCYGISFPYTKKFIIPLGLKPEAAATMQITVAAITLLPLYLYDGIAKDEFRLAPLLAMLALGAFGTGFAYIWNFQIIAAAGSSIASTVTYVTPVVAVIVGWIFKGEHISWNQPIGAIILVLGAAISQGRFNKLRA
ncbi:MAG: DMT family transporter [Actinomycetes bacterium]